jgi:hypothetical protein
MVHIRYEGVGEQPLQGLRFQDKRSHGREILHLGKKRHVRILFYTAIVYDNVNYTDEHTYLNKEVWHISVRAKIYQRLGKNVTLSFVMFYQPSIKNFDDYIINATFNLENKLSKHFYIDLHYNYEFRSEIPSDKYRHYDSVTELTLKLKF